MRVGALVLAALVPGVFAGGIAVTGASSPAPRTVDWAIYGGDAAADHYSALVQINRGNVGRLEQAWRFDTGEGELQASPLMIGGLLYAIDPQQGVFALDAATGRLKWRHKAAEPGFQPARGLSYWTDGHTKRLFASNGSYLIALDAETGRPADAFGANGRIDLREGLGRDPGTLPVYLTSPGAIFDDLIITGFRTSEVYPAAPGAVRAYDVRTGKLRWRFNLIPQPGEAGSESWPADAWKRAGGANNWPGMALDTARGIVYVPTGSAVDDFYGADRPGANLYANSLLALNARTGKLLWHFQAVHHDIWDRDFPAAPVLLTVRRSGRSIDAVAQTTKQGVVYLFDRVTGKPLFPIEEHAYPMSDVPGERAWPTQPMPLKPAPFARQHITERDLTNRTPAAHEAVLKAFRAYNNRGPFSPLRVGQPTIVFPGYDGGAEWGGPAVDRLRGVLYVNSNDTPWLGTLAARQAPAADAGLGEAIYRSQCSACHGPDRKGSPPSFPDLTNVGARRTAAEIDLIVAGGRGRMPGFPQLDADDRAAIVALLRDGTGAATGSKMHSGKREIGGASETSALYQFTGYQKFLDPDGYPAVAPPWGTLSAIDLNSGDYLWKVPLGEYPELVAQGLKDTGSENYGGPVATAGGLVIIGATLRDQKLRIFDSGAGTLLWQTRLPFAGMATPITYMAGRRQYIVIATSNARNPNGPKGSAYVAYALTR
jgi:quinoprotein glucose dehydrogenase